MVNGGIPEQLTDFFTSVAGQATQNLLQRKQQESQRVSSIASQLAGAGQLDQLPPELQNAFKKTLGAESLEALQFQSNIARQRAAPVEALRRGAVETLQAPVTEQVGTAEGPQPVTAEGAPAEGPGAPTPIFGQRAPTDVEQFQRIEELGPVGAALVGGPQLGQLSAEQANIVGRGLARTAAGKRQVTELIKTAISNGRNILQPIPVATFTPEMVPDGFVPITVEDQVVLVGAKNADFKNISDNFLRIRSLPDAPDDPRDVTPNQSQTVMKGKLQDQIAVSAAQGAQAAKLAKSTFLTNPLVQNSLEGYFDKTTGEMIPGSAITGPVLEAERKGTVTKLRGGDRDRLTQLRQGVPTFNLIQQHLKAVYGPGGALENLQASGRIPAGIRTGLARFFGTEPELIVAKRTLDSLQSLLARQFRGAKGDLNAQELTRAEDALAKLGGIPDSAEVAFGLLDSLRSSLQGGAGALLRNPKFQMPGLTTLEESPNTLVAPEESIDQSVNMTPVQVQSLLAGESPEIARRASAILEANPNTTLEQGQRLLRFMRLPLQVQQQVAQGQVNLEQAEQLATQQVAPAQAAQPFIQDEQ